MKESIVSTLKFGLISTFNSLLAVNSDLSVDFFAQIKVNLIKSIAELDYTGLVDKFSQVLHDFHKELMQSKSKDN